jgi:hypothetical protein
MKMTLKLALLVVLLALTVWIGGPREAEAAYPSCSSIRDCSATASTPWRACWGSNAELYLCRCDNYTFVCQ